MHVVACAAIFVNINRIYILRMYEADAVRKTMIFYVSKLQTQVSSCRGSVVVHCPWVKEEDQATKTVHNGTAVVVVIISFPLGTVAAVGIHYDLAAAATLAMTTKKMLTTHQQTTTNGFI